MCATGGASDVFLRERDSEAARVDALDLLRLREFESEFVFAGNSWTGGSSVAGTCCFVSAEGAEAIGYVLIPEVDEGTVA